VQTVYYLILVPMVYVALAIFIIGTGWQTVRIFRGLRFSLKTAVGPEKKPKALGAIYETLSFSRALRAHPVYWFFLLLLHVAIVLLILGHLELVAEIRVLQVIEHQVFLGRGAVGVILFVTGLFFLLRRFHSPVVEISKPVDFYVLVLLILIVLLGSQLHLARRLFDYSTIGVDEYRQYLSSLFIFRPALPEVFTEYGVGHSFLLVLHVFLANLFLMLFPASTMMHSLLALPLARLRRG